MAKQSNVSRGRVGAALFMRTGQVITSTHNKVIRGKQESGIFTVHAEELLLVKAHKMKAVARFGVSNLAILIVRWKPSIEKLAMAKPCNRCEYLINEAGIKMVYYSDSDGEIVKL